MKNHCLKKWIGAIGRKKVILPKYFEGFDQRNKQENKLELREYGVGAQILKSLGIKKIILLSNSNKKIIALDGFDIEIEKQQKI